MNTSLSDLIDRYSADIEYLVESGDADDKIIAGVLRDVVIDLQQIGVRTTP